MEKFVGLKIMCNKMSFVVYKIIILSIYSTWPLEVCPATSERTGLNNDTVKWSFYFASKKQWGRRHLSDGSMKTEKEKETEVFG